jgi:NADH dehydrogenase FAD-containing subunit
MRNHQRATGQQLRHTPLSDLLKGSGIRLVVDVAMRIDPERRHVELSNGAEPVGYDLLVYALGSHADLNAVPGAAEFAHAIAGAEQASRLWDQMRTASTIAVVGGGPTGIETATELAETFPDRAIRLVTGSTLGVTLSERGSHHLHKTFDRLRIEVREHATVARVAADGLLLEGGEHIAANAVAWTTGFRVPPLAREAGLAVGDNGRMLVDGTMRSVSHPDVYGIGDAASGRKYDGRELRMGCGPGGLTAVVAVRAIVGRLAGRSPKPLRVDGDGLCMSLGRKDGILQPIDRDGKPQGIVLTGRVAAMIKEVVLRGSMYGQRNPNFTYAAASLQT